MNICFVGHFSGGGTERITYQLANELVKRTDMSIYILNLGTNAPAFPLSGEIKYVHLGFTSLIKRVVELRKILLCNQIEVLVSIEALLGIYTIPATLGTGVKNIVWEHANYFQTQGSRWTRLIRKYWLRYADYYIVLTQRDLKNFKENEQIRCPIDFIYNPVKTLSDVATAYNVNNKIILSAGYLRPIKQFILIPRIFAPISKSNPDWQWHIYGDGAPEVISELKTEIAKYGLQERIILQKRTANMDAVYASAGIYVLTSRQEGLPTVLLEAQLHGIPCVSFDIETGPDEIIDNGINGILVPPYDTSAMSNAISQLIKDEHLRMSFSKNTANSLNKFDFELSINKWTNIIRKCYAKNS